MFKNLTEKMREGVKLQGAEDVAEFLTHSVRDALGEKYPAFFQTDFGKAIEPLVVPALVSELAKMLQNKVAGTWTNHTTGLIMYIDKTQVFEGYSPVTGDTEALFNARCMYLSSITEKMRIIDGSNTYYIEGIVEDVTASRYLDLNLREFNG